MPKPENEQKGEQKGEKRCMTIQTTTEKHNLFKIALVIL